MFFPLCIGFHVQLPRRFGGCATGPFPVTRRGRGIKLLPSHLTQKVLFPLGFPIGFFPCFGHWVFPDVLYKISREDPS